MKYSVLIIEDQAEIRNVLTKYLQKEGYQVLAAKDGFEGLDLFGSQTIHLVLLDIMLPGIDGFEVLGKLRELSDIPVIMLTARHDEGDRIMGFRNGVDDYVVKPFSMKELMLRVERLLKRVYHDELEKVYQCDHMQLHVAGMKLYKNDEEINLTTAEFRLLHVFFAHQKQVLSRDQLIEMAFGHDYEGYDRNIDSYIKRIRQKIEADPSHPRYLVSQYGAGYIFGGR